MVGSRVKSANYLFENRQRCCCEVCSLVIYSTEANDINLALYPIDLKLYILVFDTPITNLEPGCSRIPPPHHPCGGKKLVTLHVLILGNFRQKVFVLLRRIIQNH